MKILYLKIASEPASQIEAGGYHSALEVGNGAYLFGSIDAISGMYNWGDDVGAPGYKMFGSGVSASFNVQKISTRGDHDLILLSDGTVRSVGANQYGQLSMH